MPRMHVSASATATEEDIDVLSSVSFDHTEEGDYCVPGEVSVSNEDSKDSTLITVSVKDYPGLVRVIAWVLNGLELVVQKARLQTDEDGYARNQFWCTDRAGKKLRSAAAELIAERVGDFLVYCTPNKKAMQAKHFKEGPVSVDNEAHESLTVVTIIASIQVEGALLKVASALTGAGCSIAEGIVERLCKKGDGSCNEQIDEEGQDRLFKFWVTDRSGNKLDYQRATSLVYTMALVFGKNAAAGPMTAPNSTFATGS